MTPEKLSDLELQTELAEALIKDDACMGSPELIARSIVVVVGLLALARVTTPPTKAVEIIVRAAQERAVKNHAAGALVASRIDFSAADGAQEPETP